MKILVVGSGGREHALAWKLAQSPRVRQVFVAPGNGGTALAEDLRNVPIEVMDFKGLAEFARGEDIALTIVGPEAPLVAGVADALRAAGILTFGPDQAAAKLEASKHFTKQICEASGAPTAAYGHFGRQPEPDGGFSWERTDLVDALHNALK